MFNEIHANVRASEKSCIVWRMVHLYPNIGRVTPPPPRVSEADRPMSGPKIQGIPTFEDYNGLISAFSCNNWGKTFACFLNPCYWETSSLGQRFLDDSEQMMHDWSLARQTKGKYWKKKYEDVHKIEGKKFLTTTNMAFAQVVDLEYRAISRRCQEGGSFEKN